jgi:hypothetical protein
VGTPAPTSTTAHPTGLRLPSDDSEHQRPPPLPPGLQPTGSQGLLHHPRPPGAKSNFNFEVDVDEQCIVPSPASELLGTRSKAGSQAGPPASPAQQYLPELVNPDLTQALRKISWIRSITELLPTLSGLNLRAVDVKEFFRIIHSPHPDGMSPDIQMCVMWNLGYACADSSRKQRPEAGINPAGTICRHHNLHMCCKCGGRTQRGNALPASRQTSTQNMLGPARRRMDGRPRSNKSWSIGRPTCARTPCGGRSRKASCRYQHQIIFSGKTSPQTIRPALSPSESQHLQGSPGFLHKHAPTTPSHAR